MRKNLFSLRILLAVVVLMVCLFLCVAACAEGASSEWNISVSNTRPEPGEKVVFTVSNEYDPGDFSKEYDPGEKYIDPFRYDVTIAVYHCIVDPATGEEFLDVYGNAEYRTELFRQEYTDWKNMNEQIEVIMPDDFGKVMLLIGDNKNVGRGKNYLPLTSSDDFDQSALTSGDKSIPRFKVIPRFNQITSVIGTISGLSFRMVVYGGTPPYELTINGLPSKGDSWFSVMYKDIKPSEKNQITVSVTQPDEYIVIGGFQSEAGYIDVSAQVTDANGKTWSNDIGRYPSIDVAISNVYIIAQEGSEIPLELYITGGIPGETHQIALTYNKGTYDEYGLGRHAFYSAGMETNLLTLSHKGGSITEVTELINVDALRGDLNGIMLKVEGAQGGYVRIVPELTSLPGDMDSDGLITMHDLETVLDYIRSNRQTFIRTENAPASQGGIPTMQDALAILQMLCN